MKTRAVHTIDFRGFPRRSDEHDSPHFFFGYCFSVRKKTPRKMLAFAAAVATVLAMLLGLVFLLTRRAANGPIAPPRTLAQHTIFAANLTFPEKLGAASKRAGQVAARFLAKRNVSDVHFLTSEKEITELVWLLRASGIRVLHDTDVAALVDIHLEVHKELRAAMVARAKLTRVENVEEGVEKIMPVKAPVAEICTPCMPVAGTPVAHKPRNMSESVDPRKILMRVDRDGKPSYMPGWAVKHWAARARASSSGVVGTAMP